MSTEESLSDQVAPTEDNFDYSGSEKATSSDPQESTNTGCPEATANIYSQVKNSTSESDAKPSKDNDFHLIKRIEFNFERLPILLQNANGPCPLLAIFNILLLRKLVKVF